jgi:hypothetical protein
MKKKIILGLLAIVIASTGAISGSVSAAPAKTDVTGVVTDENQTPVPGAMVTVTCNGHIETDTTDAAGSYLVVFTKAQCDFGNTVKVVAKKAGKSGVASGTVEGKTTKLNLAIVNVQIPEFGLIGAMLAGGAGIGLIAYSRRRQQQAQY